MRNLLRFIDRYQVLLLFVLLEILSLTLVFSKNRFQSAFFFNSARFISGAMSRTVGSVFDYLALEENNRKLAEENVSLRSRLRSAYRNVSAEETAYRDSIYKQQFIYSSAEVVGNSVNKQYNYITLNKGRAQGIEPDMAVLCSQGIVGIVTGVSDNFSTVISVLNKDFRVSSKLKGSDYFGALMWDGLGAQYGLLTDIPHHAKIAVGDTIVTSGLSPIFPEGIPIGIIDKFSLDDGNFYNIKVHFLTDFHSIRYVSVVKNFYKEEQLLLESRIAPND